MTDMRRKDKQTTDAFAWDVVDKCHYAILSMIDKDGNPYGVPVTIARMRNSIYFHSALEGKKITSLRKSPKVWLTCVSKAETQQMRSTVFYHSAMVSGTAEELVRKEDIIAGMRLLSQRHTPENMESFDKRVSAALPKLSVWKIHVETISGKASGEY